MGKTISMVDIVKKLAEPYKKPKDFSVCGKCSKCGECCSNFLPISQSELDIIQKYVLENNIKPQKQMLVMQNRLCCPYYNGNKCLIYEVRPLICKEFYCYKDLSIDTAKKFLKEKRYSVDMWKIAEDIERLGNKK